MDYENAFSEFSRENLISAAKGLISKYRDLEIRFRALRVGMQYLATVIDEYEHDAEEDDHLRRFMEKLTSCVDAETSFEYAEAHYETLEYALKDRMGEDQDSNFEDDGEF